MKKLIIGEFPENYNKNDHIIFSDFSLKNFNQYKEIKTHLFSPKSFNDKMNLADQIEKLTLHFCKVFSKKYNPNIYLDYSFDFWKNIYFPSLYHIITIIDIFHRSIQNIILDYPNYKIQVDLIKDPIFSEIKKEEDFFNNLNVSLQEKILSVIILNFSEFSINYKNSNKTKNEKEKAKSYKSKVDLISIFNSIFFRSTKSYGFGFLSSIFFHLLLSILNKSKVRVSKKQSKIDIPKNYLYEKLIESLLCEDLKSLTPKINRQKKMNFRKNHIRLVSNEIYFDTKKKIIAALAEEAKEIVIPFQHGGYTYGSHKAEKGMLNSIEYSKDYFITWGWQERTSQNKSKTQFIPLPSPLLSKMQNKFSNKNDKIIFVSSLNNLINLRYEESIIKEKNLKNIELKRNLIIKLQTTFGSKNIYFRPYPNSLSYCFNEKFFFPAYNQLKGSLHKEILKCKILILDHPGTTWNIAMAANTPTLLIFDFKQFDFTNKTINYLNEFERLKIYHKDLKSLLSHIKSFEDKSDLLKWWNSTDVQRIRKSWTSEYALSDNLWFFQWIKKLKSI